MPHKVSLCSSSSSSYNVSTSSLACDFLAYILCISASLWKHYHNISRATNINITSIGISAS
uniref:Uncharacterized protein n=1 Tax=Cucumis melo TaxID=3656 RepID=A0A9I9EBL4_CUCME